MKQTLVIGTAIALAFGLTACAETTTGKVVSTKGDHVTITEHDGTHKVLKTTANTTYRKKKQKHHHYQPMIEENDFVEVIYSPGNNELIIEEVTILDD